MANQVRYYLSDLPDSLTYSQYIRIESDGQTNYGRLDLSDESVNWEGREESRAVTRNAIEVACGLDVPGWQYAGQESYAEMSDAFDARWDAQHARTTAALDSPRTEGLL